MSKNENTGLIFFFIGVFLCASASGAYARKYFHIQRPRLSLGLSWEYEEEKRTGPFINTTGKTRGFRERAGIETEGWVYHPALFQYTLRFEPELRQIKDERDPGESIRESTYAPSYFVDVTLLPLKPYTLRVFGQQREDRIRSAFAEKTDIKSRSYGADLSLKYRLLPTTMSYSHLDSEQTGFYISDEVRDDLRITMRNSIKKSNTRLTTRLSDNTRTTSGIPTRTKTADSNLFNEYNITGNRRLMLNSSLNYRWTESNTFENTFFRVFENLIWRHSDTLKTDYFLNYNQNNSKDFENKTGAVGARLTHILYDNLTTTVAGDATANEFTTGNENILGTRLDFDYRRKIPWGSLNLGLGWNYRMTGRDSDQVPIQVTNERHALSTGGLTLLDNKNADLNSIVVTDIGGTVTYIENIDYRLEEIDSFVRISRTTFGSITDGQTVLVSYRYLSDPAYDDAVFGQAYRINLNLWSALRLSYRFFKADQAILSGTPPPNPVNDTINAAEARFVWRWTDTTLRFEDADRTSSLSTRTWRAEETLTFRPLPRFFLTLSGHYGKRLFKERNDTEDLYGVKSTLDWGLTRRWRLGFEGSWDNILGQTEKTFDTRGSAILGYSYRIWRGGIRYDFIHEEDMISEQTRIRHALVIEVIRSLW